MKKTLSRLLSHRILYIKTTSLQRFELTEDEVVDFEKRLNKNKKGALF